jgi:thiosulfate dehydrogenase
MNKNRAVSLLGPGLVFLVGVLSAPAVALADASEWSIARGGLLYDKWYKVIGEKAPGEKHPLYPADGKYASKPGTTWRCKECHGWDYMGKDGAYAKGKHHTGIVGIRGMDGGDPGKVIALLKDKDHAYGMPKGGDKAKGASYYNTVCARCHGLDGTEPDDMDKSLGKQMGNPWEVMHKIMNGHPDEQMPALRAFDRSAVVDIMSHITTLPKKP